MHSLYNSSRFHSLRPLRFVLFAVFVIGIVKSGLDNVACNKRKTSAVIASGCVSKRASERPLQSLLYSLKAYRSFSMTKVVLLPQKWQYYDSVFVVISNHLF